MKTKKLRSHFVVASKLNQYHQSEEIAIIPKAELNHHQYRRFGIPKDAPATLLGRMGRFLSTQDTTRFQPGEPRKTDAFLTFHEILVSQWWDAYNGLITKAYING